MTPLILLTAVVAGWVLQMLMTYRQTDAFNREVRELRRHGTVAVGVGGRRYRGGRAFVALSADEDGRVVRAISLSGWTTFSRATPLPALQGLTVARLRRESPVDVVTKPQREAARAAADTLGTPGNRRTQSHAAQPA